jgi:hypothetical protein
MSGKKAQQRPHRRQRYEILLPLARDVTAWLQLNNPALQWVVGFQSFFSGTPGHVVRGSTVLSLHISQSPPFSTGLLPALRVDARFASEANLRDRSFGHCASTTTIEHVVRSCFVKVPVA